MIRLEKLRDQLAVECKIGTSEDGFHWGFNAASAEYEKFLDKLPEIIKTALEKYEQEMQGFLYFGSNPGVSRDDYDDIIKQALQKLKEFRGES